MRNLILGGVLRGIFMIQVRLVPQKSIFDLFGQKWPARMVTVKSSLSRCQQHLFDPFLSLLILFLYFRRLLHKKSGRWIWCCPLLQAFIKKDWEGESCSISFYIHCLLHLLLGLLYGLVKWTSNMDWQPKNNILRTRGWIWERIASWISWSNIRRTQQNL